MFILFINSRLPKSFIAYDALLVSVSILYRLLIGLFLDFNGIMIAASNKIICDVMINILFHLLARMGLLTKKDANLNRIDF